MYKTHPDIPESIDERAKAFMLSCFQPEAKDRPSAKQVCSNDELESRTHSA